MATQNTTEHITFIMHWIDFRFYSKEINSDKFGS